VQDKISETTLPYTKAMCAKFALKTRFDKM